MKNRRKEGRGGMERRKKGGREERRQGRREGNFHECAFDASGSRI